MRDRPEWLPDRGMFGTGMVEAELKVGCSFCDPLTGIEWATQSFVTADGWIAWCDSPDCEQAAREAICGGEE